jgi:hypothetical protein
MVLSPPAYETGNSPHLSQPIDSYATIVLFWRKVVLPHGAHANVVTTLVEFASE